MHLDLKANPDQSNLVIYVYHIALDEPFLLLLIVRMSLVCVCFLLFFFTSKEKFGEQVMYLEMHNKGQKKEKNHYIVVLYIVHKNVVDEII